MAPFPTDKPRTHEAETDSGYAVRIRYQPLSDGTVRVLDWRRRRPHWAHYRRDATQIGRVHRPEQLRLPAIAPLTLFAAEAEPAKRTIRRGRR